ncbi:uroporphyrinogen-III synthase [Halobacillus sp. A5]|uniref:uroporphyrinogen-III synthase n=1 Tax=Halobacillus sp. A5 TaxID=2880263 RepID=UPI0020A62F8F|nr:uroporphyrinogen-III synthase [Halobacillus sp. A5]MCP3028322.1 uroporphyrinogen-III synthase [Halobacillus sp. A5]
MSGLTDKTVAIAADRQAESIGELVRKQGGAPLSFPIQGQKVLNEKDAEADVKKLIESHFDYVILTTGIGSKTLEEAAERLGLQKEYIQALRNTKLAVRGSKTLKWLKENELEPDIVSSDGTMNELVEAISSINLEGQRFFLQQYNKEEQELLDRLNGLPIQLYESLPYHYVAPGDETISELRSLITGQKVDAVVFTSKTQVQNLFEENREALKNGFNGKVTAVAVGSITAAELRKNEVVEHIVEPSKPKMGAMIIALTQYFKANA